MHLLHVTDLHFHRPWFQWVARCANDFDAIVISGDVLDLYHPTPQDAQIEWVSGWAGTVEVPLVICSGNHDLDQPGRCAWLPKLSAACSQVVTDRQILRRDCWTVEAVPFGKLPRRGGENHVVVTHRAPAGASTARLRHGNVDCGDPQLSRHLASATEAPWLILSGDVHEPRRWWARAQSLWSFNPGGFPEAHPGVPNHLALDLQRGTAHWADGWGQHHTATLR